MKIVEQVGDARHLDTINFDLALMRAAPGNLDYRTAVADNPRQLYATNISTLPQQDVICCAAK
jgi:hypothetical protein